MILDLSSGLLEACGALRSRSALPFFSLMLIRPFPSYRMPAPKGCSEAVYEVMKECWEADPEKRIDFPVIHEAMKEIQTELHEQAST